MLIVITFLITSMFRGIKNVLQDDIIYNNYMYVIHFLSKIHYGNG